jgi:hypothetical protein
MAAIIVLLGDTGSDVSFTFTGADGAKSLTGDAPFTVIATTLSGQLSMTPGNVDVPSVDDEVKVLYPEILTEVYFDFTCSNLTYQQGL